MIDRAIGTKSVDQSVAKYIKAATDHGNATESGDHRKANSAADELEAAHQNLLALGQEGETALTRLLKHEDRGVRLWAAAHTLDVAPIEAESVLRDLAAQRESLIGFSAEMTLRQWRGKRGS